MAKVKVSRGDLKRDELRDFGTDLREWYERRHTLIWVVVGCLLALLVLSKVWGAYRERRKIESSQMYYVAVNTYQQALMTQDPEQRKTLMDQVQAAAVNVRNRFPSSIAARQSLLLVGNALYYQDKPELALTQFNEFSESAANPDEEAIGSIAIAYCYENIYFNERMRDVSKWQKALDFYKKAASQAADGELKRQAMLGQARMYEYHYNLAEALKVHEQVLKMAEEAKKVDEGKFFGKEGKKEEPSKLQILNPADVYDTASLAKQQIERLKALIGAGAAIDKERSLPAATAPTTQSATAPATQATTSATTQTATAPAP